MSYFNRAYMTSATTGTGTLTLGSAVDGYQTFAAAGVADGDLVSYVIEEGNKWEVGTGTYTATGTTLARTTVHESSNAGAAENLVGSAKVFLTAIATDLNPLVKSDPTGITGADALTNMMSLTQAEYDAIGAPDAATLYVIV